MAKPLTPELEALAAIGAWTLRQTRSRPDMIADLERDVMARFVGRYPHHKRIAHWLIESKAAPEKDVTPTDVCPSELPDVADFTVGELIERLYFFPPGAIAFGQMEEGEAVPIVNVNTSSEGVVLQIKKGVVVATPLVYGPSGED